MSDDRTEPDHLDPRLQEQGDQAMPGEVVDSFENMPGDQPSDDDRPSKTDLTEDPEPEQD